MKTITLKAFKKLNPCWLESDEKSSKLEEIGLRKDRWSAVDILRLSNDEVSAEDRLWSARWLIDDKIMHEFACRCAEEALKLVESPDPRSVAAIAAKRAWLRGEINDEQLAAARDAARRAAWAAAVAAARDAARAAAWAAAEGATWAAAWAAAGDAARENQIMILLELLKNID